MYPIPRNQYTTHFNYVPTIQRSDTSVSALLPRSQYLESRHSHVRIYCILSVHVRTIIWRL